MNENEYQFGQNEQRKEPPAPGSMTVTEKSKDFAGTFLKILKCGKAYLPIMVIAIFCAMGGAALTIIGPDRISQMTNLMKDGLAGEMDMPAIVSIGMGLISIYAASAAMTCGQNMVMARITQKISQSLRTDISQKIDRLPMSYYGRTTTGDVLSRVTNDVDTIGQSLNQSVDNMVSAVVTFVGCLMMLLITDAWMTLTVVFTSLIGFLFMGAVMGKSQQYFVRQQKHLGELNGYIEEIYTGHMVVKAYNGERAAAETFDRMNGHLQESGFKAQCLSGLMMPFMNFIGNL